MSFLLLGTKGCHLCEYADELINECFQKENNILIEYVDIAEQTQWQADYATRIPVLLHQGSKHSLNWPFTKEHVLTFIEQYHD